MKVDINKITLNYIHNEALKEMEKKMYECEIPENWYGEKTYVGQHTIKAIPADCVEYIIDDIFKTIGKYFRLKEKESDNDICLY